MKIIAVSEVRTAKDGRNYFVATFRPGYGQKLVKRTFWEQFVNDSKGNKTDRKVWERATPEETNDLLMTKATIEAQKVTRRVESYLLGDKLVNHYSVVVFPDEYGILPNVFASQGHKLVDEQTGEVIEPTRAITIIPTNPVNTELEGQSAFANVDEAKATN